MTREKRQFRTLVRLFAYRFFDNEIISLRGDVSALLGQFAALLLALSFVLVLMIVPKYTNAAARLTPAQIRAAGWMDEEFLISISMTVIAVFTLLLWDALFPDRRDCLILGAMPVRVRTLFRAKIAALTGALLLAAGAVNCFTGFAHPFLILPGHAGFVAAVRHLAAWWLVMLASAVFVFLLLLDIQGMAIHLLPHALFLRWSSIIQCLAFFGALTLCFLMPPLATPQALADPRNAMWYAVLPPYWFLGLFQTLVGASNPALHALAVRAVTGVTVAAALAIIVYALAYSRQMRRTVEQSGIVSRDYSRAGGGLRVLGRGQLQRGLLAFIGQTLARSRQHRLLLSIYVGIGLAWIFSQIAHTLYEAPGLDAAFERQRVPLAVPLVILFFVITGLRVSFSIPVDLRANWLFRLADPFGAGAYLAATRKTLLALGVAPVVAISFAACCAAGTWERALRHCAFLTVFGVFVAEMAVTGFAKVPFTCAWMPGRSNLKLMFGIYAGLIMFLSEAVSALETLALGSQRGYFVLMGVSIAAWAVAARRDRRIRTALGGLHFEEQPVPVIHALELLPRD
ncbi:MAG TPA: hypothetical protein VFA04_13375 [Bryobacteraceae bacterium]|nr:hypothetical protein [Bryobacteraceae bacterium]